MSDLLNTLKDILDPQIGREIEQETLEMEFWTEWRESKDFSIAMETAKSEESFDAFVKSMQESWLFWLNDRWNEWNN